MQRNVQTGNFKRYNMEILTERVYKRLLTQTESENFVTVFISIVTIKYILLARNNLKP